MKNSPWNAPASLALMLAFGMGTALAGCAPESNGSIDAGASSQTASDDSAAGFVDEDSEVPGWVSDAFPIFPGSEVVAVSEINDANLIVSFYSHSTGGQAPVFDWFTEQYSQNGWTIEDTDAKNGALDATHSNGHSAKINVTAASGVTSYVLHASKG